MSCFLRRRISHSWMLHLLVFLRFSQIPRKFTSKVEGKMGYEDFVYFILSEEDKTSEPSLEYWYFCSSYFVEPVLLWQFHALITPLMKEYLVYFFWSAWFSNSMLNWKLYFLIRLSVMKWETWNIIEISILWQVFKWVFVIWVHVRYLAHKKCCTGINKGGIPFHNISWLDRIVLLQYLPRANPWKNYT